MIKNLPVWLKGGIGTAIIGTIIFSFLPDNFSNLAFAPWYVSWFDNIAFLIFGSICILFNIDFISDAASKTDRFIVPIIWSFSVFISFFLIGVAATYIVMTFKKHKKNKKGSNTLSI